ncbi:hypothetical protein [Acrocarpospora catenulata]|uniref:hypothetical protein n=1 Tax=Acrocarpospora catenulata TaxID=2836182 RepID=UPI001BDB6C93|nr:hypothetical protein [Acrocarpospora catenulata]
MLFLAGCLPVLGDPAPRPVGFGRTGDGRIRFVVVLCPGERLAPLTASDWERRQPIWKVSQPDDTLRHGGRITLGDGRGFAKTEVPMVPALPTAIDATAELADGRLFGSASDVDGILQDLAGSNDVLDLHTKGSPKTGSENR